MLLGGSERFDRDDLEGFRLEGIDAVELLEGGISLWKGLGLTERVRTFLEEGLVRQWADRELDRCRDLDVTVVTVDDEAYPDSLRRLPGAPLALYLRGAFPSLEGAVAVVGTRRCSTYGRRVAHDLGCRLSQIGLAVVSGGASGIDGAAHSGALDGGFPTVAVLGTGVDRVFPQGHEDLSAPSPPRGRSSANIPWGRRPVPGVSPGETGSSSVSPRALS